MLLRIVVFVVVKLEDILKKVLIILGICFEIINGRVLKKD